MSQQNVNTPASESIESSVLNTKAVRRPAKAKADKAAAVAVEQALEKVEIEMIPLSRLAVAIALLKADAEQGYAEMQAGRLILSSPLGFPKLNVSPNVFRACERSFGNELSAWKAGHKVVAIVETEPPTRRYERINGRNVPITEAEVIGIALMRVTPRFIPVDSGYEAIIEARLCEEERSFIKPLRFDAEEDTLPDFVLTDVDGKESVPMEVFGMNTDEYRARRAVKTEGYNKEYGVGGWWSWDATRKDAEENIPAFPAQRD